MQSCSCLANTSRMYTFSARSNGTELQYICQQADASLSWAQLWVLRTRPPVMTSWQPSFHNTVHKNAGKHTSVPPSKLSAVSVRLLGARMSTSVWKGFTWGDRLQIDRRPEHMLRNAVKPAYPACSCRRCWHHQPKCWATAVLICLNISANVVMVH